jgi:hypothetical protein
MNHLDIVELLPQEGADVNGSHGSFRIKGNNNIRQIIEAKAAALTERIKL